MAVEMRILVVDDDRDAADSVADHVREGIDGATVDVRYDTENARDRLDDTDYDAVVSDYRIGDSDGLAFLETVREIDDTVPFVIYTGTGSEGVASRAIGAGVTDYILKTDDGAGERLLDRLRTATSRRRAIEEIDIQRSPSGFLVDQSLVGVAVVQDGTFQYVNERFADIVGYDRQELVEGFGPADVVDDSDLPRVREQIEQRFDGEATTGQYTFTAVRKDGQRRTVEVFDGRIEYDGEPAVVGLLLPQSPDRRRERGLAALGDAARDLVAATTRDRVAEVAVTSTRSVLEREFGAIYSRGDGAFEPVATTPGFDALFGGGPPTFPGDSFLASVDEDDECRRFDDGDHLGEPIGSGVAASLGRHGVYLVGAPEPNAFDEASVDLAELLAASVESALDRTLREERLAGLNEATEGLVRASTSELVAELAVRTASDVLGFDLTTVHVRETDDRGPYLRPVAATEQRRALSDTLPEIRPGETPLWTAYDANEICQVTDVRSATEPTGAATSMRSLLAFPLGTHGTLTAGATTAEAFDDVDVELGRALAATVAAALDRTDHEQRLEALYEAGERLQAAETPEAVAVAAVETARDVLDHDLCAIHAPDGDQLVPVAATDACRALLGDLPVLECDGSLAGEAYERDETLQFADVRDAEPSNPDTAVRSELLLPLGEHGVFIVSATTEGAFGRTEVRLAELFAASVRAALARAEREATVARQNERLEEFASVVSHDLRNPLGVAMGRLEIAMESTDDPSLPVVERALDRMEALIDDLLTLARQGQTLAETEPVALEPLVRDVWRSQDAIDATLVVADDLPTVDGDPGRLRQLFENLLGNALRHVGPAVTVTVGRSDRGFYVADDGSGIPPENREQVLEGGYTTSREGTGFGLAIVRSIAGAHGWSVDVTGSDEGGARFEFVR